MREKERACVITLTLRIEVQGGIGHLSFVVEVGWQLTDTASDRTPVFFSILVICP